MRTASASPLDDPHVGGLGFSGPTTGDLAAVYWNPAALALMQGAHVQVSGTFVHRSMRVERAPIDRSTGLPGAGPAIPGTTTSDVKHPGVWPPGPGSFAAAGVTVANRFTLALAAYTPFAQQVGFQPTSDGSEPTRFHAVAIDLRNVALVPALAFRVGNNLRLGVAPGFLFSVGRMTFDEDVALAGGSAGLAADCGGMPCGAENSAAAARYDLSSGLSPFDSSLGFTMAGGIHFRRDRWELGAAYTTRPLGDAGHISVIADKSAIALPARAGGGSVCPANRPDRCVFARIDYELPDVLTAGATFHVNRRLDVAGIFRMLRFSAHERVHIRVSGPASGTLTAQGLPENVLFHRGFEDAFDARLRVAYLLRPSLRVGAALRFESSAVAAQRVSPAAIDGAKWEPAVMAELRVRSWFRLNAGYAFAFMPSVDTNGSIFDPAAATACADAQGDLATPACASRLAGTARPTAQGRYGLSRHTLTLSAAASF